MALVFRLLCLILCAQAALVLTAAVADGSKDSKLQLDEQTKQDNATATKSESPNDFHAGYDMMDFLGLGNQRHYRLKRHLPLTNSASQFLLEIYQMIRDSDGDELSNLDADLPPSRKKREAILTSTLESPVTSNQNYEHIAITERDQMEIGRSNNIITFSSRGKRKIDKINKHFR